MVDLVGATREVGRAIDQGDVDQRIQDLFLDHVAAVGFHRQLHILMAFPELDQRFQQHRYRKRVIAADGQHVRRLAGAVGFELGVDPSQFLQQRPDGIDEGPAMAGQLDTAVAGLVELKFELFFQALQLHGNGRLAHVQFGRRVR